MEGSGIKVYSYRWVVLGAFSLINLSIQILWICFAPVAGPAAEYYGVSDMKIGLLAMIFMIVYIPAAIPASWMIDRFGFKKGVGLGAVLLGGFGLLRGMFPGDYHTVMALTIGIALAQPLLLNAFTTLAAKWFPFQERAMVSGLAMAANFLGTAAGLMLTPTLVENYGMDRMQLIYGVIAAISAAVFLMLAREEPPTPASPEGFTERALMLDGLKMMLRQKDFWYCMVIFFVGVGVFNGLATWIEDMVRPRGMSPHQAGMMGGFLLIGGIAGAAVIPALSDHYHQRKPFMLLGMALSIPGIIGFTYFQGYAMLLASVFVLGFFMMGLGPIGYQYAAEITYPAPEGTSNGLLALAGQISVVFIFGMAAMKEALGSFTPSLVLGAGLMAINCLLIARLQESKLLEKMSGEMDGE
ncbi:MAG TPA: MFS transporter [bacterium]|nr:MFS transporter [bacterium]